MYYYGRGLEGFRPDPWTMGPLIVADGVLWVWAMNVTRISVALMLLRFRDSRSRLWVTTVWVVICVQACMLTVGTIMHLIMCRPISARWAPTPSADCINPEHFMVYGFIFTGKQTSSRQSSIARFFPPDCAAIAEPRPLNSPPPSRPSHFAPA